MLPSSKFNQAWRDKVLSRPLVILIGGYAGTGKSTLANALASRIAHIQTIPTGIFRSIAQVQPGHANNAALFLPTYQLDEVHGNTVEAITAAYREQCAPATDIIHSVIRFLAVEKQHLIIEGNHILPEILYDHPDCHIIELYLYVDDEVRHRTMLGGPTHQRNLSEQEFMTGRTIHDMLRAEATAHRKPQFESNNTEAAIAYVERKIADILQQTKDSHGKIQ